MGRFNQDTHFRFVSGLLTFFFYILSLELIMKSCILYQQCFFFFLSLSLQA